MSSTSFPRGIDTKEKKQSKRTLAEVVENPRKKPKKSESVEELSFGKLNVGCSVLGCILQICESNILVSLPGGFTGIVDYSEISDVTFREKMSSVGSSSGKKMSHKNIIAVQSLVRPLQIVRCCIINQNLNLESKRKTILLSMRSSLINKGIAMKHLSIGFPLSGCVLSKEDNGYIIASGITGVSCFLPDKFTTKNQTLQIGQPVECVIATINEAARTVTLRQQSKAVREAIVSGTSLTFNSLCPGMMFNVVVDEISEGGLIVIFLGIFYGVVDNSSLDISHNKDQISVGDVLRARIVFVDLASKMLRFSLKKHIIEFQSLIGLPQLGSIVSRLTVTEVHKKQGIVLQDAHNLDPMKAQYFIHKKSLSDDNKENVNCIDADKIHKVYRLGDTVEVVKVKGYNLVEGWILASNMREYISGIANHHSEVNVGQVLDVVISAIREFGLVLKIGRLSGISAICPNFHTSDVVVENKLKKKFKIGQHCSMRVWEMSGKSIIMTNKKTMVEISNENIIKSYDDATVGKKSGGVISKISSRDGITVHFFNKVKGLLPRGILLNQGVYNPSESYRIGQVVNIIVVRCVAIPENKQFGKHDGHFLYLGLDMNISPEILWGFVNDLHSSKHSSVGDNTNLITNSTCAITTKTDLSGQQTSKIEFVSGVISSVSEHDSVIHVLLDDGRIARTERMHFFDFACTSDAVFSSRSCEYVVGYRILKALVLSESRGIVFITCKPFLLCTAELLNSSSLSSTSSSLQKFSDEIHLPQIIDELSPGQMLAGYISKVESFGVLVKFRSNFVALAPRPNLSDRFISNPAEKFNVGDSVKCAVQRVDLAKGRALVTLKSSLVSPSLSLFLQSYFAEVCQRSLHAVDGSFHLINYLKRNPLSSVVKATVTSFEEFGTVFAGEENITIVARDSSVNSTQLTVGQIVEICLINIDYENCVLEGTLNYSLFKARDKSVNVVECNSSVAIAESNSSDLRVVASILLVKDSYLVVVSREGSLGFVAIADFHNPFPENSEYKVDELINLKFLTVLPKDRCCPHSGFPAYGVFQDFSSNDRRSAIAKVQQEASESDAKLREKFGETDTRLSAVVLKQRFFENLRVGSLMKWTIVHISPHEVTVVPDEHDLLKISLSAKIHLTGAINRLEINDDLRTVLSSSTDVSLPEAHPFFDMKIGAKIWCYILQIRRREKNVALEEGDSNKEEIMVYLATTFKTTTNHSYGTTVQKNEYLPFQGMIQPHGKNGCKTPCVAVGVVTNISDLGVVVGLSPYVSTMLNFADISDDISLVKLCKEKCFVGMRLSVIVTAVSKQKSLNQFTVSRAFLERLIPRSGIMRIEANNQITDKSLLDDSSFSPNVGDIVVGCLNLTNFKLPKPPAIMVNLQDDRLGRICVTELADVNSWVDMKEAFYKNTVHKCLPSGQKHGQILRCIVLSVSEKFIELSLRASIMDDDYSTQKLLQDYTPVEGSIVKGYVVNTSVKGCFVRLSRTLTAQVLMKDLSDEFVEDPLEAFPVGMLVTGRVLSFSHAASTARLSLRRSVIFGKSVTPESLELTIGDDVSGEIKRISDFGVFIQLNGSHKIGLSRRNAALDDENDVLENYYKVGDLVRAKVLSVSEDKQKIGLGLRAFYFRGCGMYDDQKTSQPEPCLTSEIPGSLELKAEDSETSFRNEYFCERKVIPKSTAEKFRATEETVDNSTVLAWDDFTTSTELPSLAMESVLNDESQAATRRRRNNNEEYIDNIENLRRTSDDFEKLVISQPNSSYVWLQYMSHFLESSDVESGRAIALRAINTIHYREEEEKYNIWVAFLNMEYKYGNMDSLNKIFTRAITESKTKKIFLALADTYQTSEDFAGAQDVFDKALHRPQLKKSKKVWSAYLQFKVRLGNPKEAKEQLARAMQALSRHKHVEVITKFALAEFEYGSADRGRALFEDLLNSYPKRTDLWHILLDREIKMKNFDMTRTLFERMIHSKASTRHLKLVFKKYLAFELQNGTFDSQERVKQLARDYVNSIA